MIIEFVVVGAALLFLGFWAGYLFNWPSPASTCRANGTVIALVAASTVRSPGSKRTDEVGQLATALNTMLDDLDVFTERDATEEALRGSEERMRRFVADVSHELRTPLAAVSAYTKLSNAARKIARKTSSERCSASTSKRRECASWLRPLLLARLDEGLPLSHEPIDLNEVVVESIRAARAMAPAWPVSLRASDVVVVSGDGRRCQVFDNLLTNVSSHTPAGTGVPPGSRSTSTMIGPWWSRATTRPGMS